MQTASSFTFSHVQLFSFCNWGTDKNMLLTIIKTTQTGIYCNKINFLHYEIIRAPQKFQKPLASFS
jgi:hypothetical protein